MGLKVELLNSGWSKDLDEAGWKAKELGGKIIFSKRGRNPVTVYPAESLKKAILDLRKVEMLPIYARDSRCQKVPMYVTCNKCGLEEIHVGLLYAGYLTGAVFIRLMRPPPDWRIEVGADGQPLATGICKGCSEQEETCG
jgi:hypothetical protein